MRALLVIDVQGTAPVVSEIKRKDGREMAPEEREMVIRKHEEEIVPLFNAMIDRICDLTAVSITTGSPVILMEESHLIRSTNHKIRSVLDGVPHITVRKKQHDGSQEFALAHKLLGIPIEEVVVCGLMTTICVAKTVNGLRRMGYKVKVDAVFPDAWDDRYAEGSFDAPPFQPEQPAHPPDFCSSVYA